MRKILPLLLALIAAPVPAAAHLLDFTAGLQVWNHGPTGNISYVGTNNDLKNNLGLGSKTQLGGWVSLEHPIPMLPNVKLAYTQVSSDGSGKLAAPFGGIGAAANVTSKVTLNQGDIILYYSPLNNIVKLDLGLDVKVVDGNAKLTDKANPATPVDKSFAAPVPMLYTNVRVKLPFTGLSVGAQGSIIAYAGNHLWDVRAGASYESSLGIGVSAGYRDEELKLNNVSHVNLDASVKGPYGAVFYHF